MCLDEFESPILFGSQGSENRNIEINVIPCKPEQLTSRNASRRSKACIADLKSPKAMEARFRETIKYLNSPQLNTMVNTSRFDLLKYKTDKIAVHEAIIKTV